MNSLHYMQSDSAINHSSEDRTHQTIIEIENVGLHAERVTYPTNVISQANLSDKVINLSEG